MSEIIGTENAYVMKGGQKLRCGFTTGSCAAAASRAAAYMLLAQRLVKEVEIDTPAGIRLKLTIINAEFTPDMARCAVEKDGGDDPDVTNHALIYSTVRRLDGISCENGKPVGDEKFHENEIRIDGGTGVGRVTEPGLDQPVGNAAINHVPREMIAKNVEEIRSLLDEHCGLFVEISVPEGEEIAKHTFNPRLGIVGGISILGTSGIVRPMSEEALIRTIRVEMQMQKASGSKLLLITPGNYGQDFLKRYPDVARSRSIKCSNYVGKALEMAVELGFEGVLFVAHLGKFIKVSGGIMNTHSHEADCRAELLSAQAMRAGVDPEICRALLDTGTTEEAVNLLLSENCLDPVMKVVMEKIRYYMGFHIEKKIPAEAICFSSVHGLLGETEGAQKLLEKIRAERNPFHA